MTARATRLPFSVWTALALLGILALAAGLRFFQIDRLPPGLSYDEAWNNLEALRIVHRSAIPVYVVDERGEGEEPLHIWLIAALFALTGPHALGGRWVSALLGTLTVPLLFLAAREMLRAAPSPRSLSLAGRGEAAIALLAAFILATLYWHVHYTRLGMEPPTVPALATLTFWLLWRAFNRGGWLDYASAGGALGLSLYTHISARFVPLVVVLFAVWRWGHDRALIRRELPRLALLVACAAVIFAPLGLFFVENPDLFVYRARQASAVAFGGSVIQTWGNAIKVIGGLFWRGDTNLRLNLPGRPGLDIVQSLLFVMGAIYALGRERRRALTFPLIWTGVMILPSVFSDSAPHFGRMLGATPAIAILIALGCAQLLQTGSAVRNPQFAIQRAARLGLAVAIVAPVYSAARMGRNYFVTWARDPGLYTAFDVGLRESAEYLASLPREELISLSPVDRDLPVLRFAFRDDVSRLKTFNGRRCAVYPAQPERDWTHVAIVAQETNSLNAIQRAFPSGQAAKKFFDVGTPYAVAFRVQAGARAQIPQEALALFGEQVALVNLQIPSDTIRAGETLPVTIAWQSRAAINADYTIFVHLTHLLDRPPTAQEDTQPCDNSYPTTWWSPGEIIQENRRIVIPANTPPGPYLLTTGIYDATTGKRLLLRSPPAQPGDQYVLGWVTVTP